MKKKQWFIGLAVLIAAAGGLKAASSFFTDIFTVTGRGTLYNTAVMWLDTNRDLSLYDGDIYLGASGNSISATNFAGLKMPFFNASGAAMVQGTVVLASATAVNGTYGYGTTAAVLSTTTVLGVCEGSVANGAIGFMTVSGYALVLTTGPVHIGDILVSTGTVAGYAGATPAPTSGTDIGVALSSGTTAGGLTLVRLR